MTWLDIVLIVLGALGLLVGLKLGLLKAVLLVGGGILGLILAAQISQPLASGLTDSVGDDSVATVIAYAIVLVVVIAAALVAAAILRKTLDKLLLGWVDMAGGAILGLGSGVLAGVAIIAMVARLTFLVPEHIPGIGERIEAREQMKAGLVDSELVPYYLDGLFAMPGDTIGMIPDDFEQALREADRRITERKQQES